MRYVLNNWRNRKFKTRRVQIILYHVFLRNNGLEICIWNRWRQDYAEAWEATFNKCAALTVNRWSRVVVGDPRSSSSKILSVTTKFMLKAEQTHFVHKLNNAQTSPGKVHRQQSCFCCCWKLDSESNFLTREVHLSLKEASYHTSVLYKTKDDNSGRSREMICFFIQNFSK